VEPLILLDKVQNESGTGPIAFSKFSLRVTTPLPVQADMQQVTIEQIIAVEGERDPNQGLSARELRQAWIFVFPEGGGPDPDLVERLEFLSQSWEMFFAAATGGLGSVATDLQ